MCHKLHSKATAQVTGELAMKVAGTSLSDFSNTLLVHSDLYGVQMHAEALPDNDKNPYGNGFIGVETPLKSESKAARVADATKGVYWKVNNPASCHAASGMLLLRTINFSHAALLLLGLAVLPLDE